MADKKVLGKIMVKVLSALTPDDVRELKRLGLKQEVERLLSDRAGMLIRWRSVDYPPDDEAWGDAWTAMDGLRAAFRE
jgi:hypothetical protein